MFPTGTKITRSQKEVGNINNDLSKENFPIVELKIGTSYEDKPRKLAELNCAGKIIQNCTTCYGDGTQRCLECEGEKKGDNCEINCLYDPAVRVCKESSTDTFTNSGRTCKNFIPYENGKCKKCAQQVIQIMEKNALNVTHMFFPTILLLARELELMI